MRSWLAPCLKSGLVYAILWTDIALSLSQMPMLSGPEKDYLRARVTFTCEAPQVAPPLLFELLKDAEDRVLDKKSPQDGWSVNFSLPVDTHSTGSYRCRMTPRGSADQGLPLYSNSLRFQVVIPVLGAYLRTNFTPAGLYEGQTLTLSCQVQQGSHLVYSWLRDRRQLAASPGGANLIISPVSLGDAGSYSCGARNDVPNSRVSYSKDVQVAVKALLSKPKISFAVTKNGTGYRADVTCWSARGSPPVQFWLFLNDMVVTSRAAASQSTRFSVPILLGKRLGEMWCEVENAVQRLASKAVTLEVVPVGGDLHLQVEHLHDAASTVVAALLRCTPTRGTFPEFAWFLNGSPLEGRGNSHIMANRNRSLLLMPLTAENSGDYHCEAKDSFDNTSGIRSPAHQIHHSTASHMVTMEIISVVFSCFLLLVILGSASAAFAIGRRAESGTPPVRHSGPRSSIFDLLEIPSRSNVGLEMVNDDNTPHHGDPNAVAAEEGHLQV